MINVFKSIFFLCTLVIKTVAQLNHKIIIVYYAFISQKYQNWRYLLSVQLSELVPINDSNTCDIHAVFSSENSSVFAEATNIAQKQLTNIKVHEFLGNYFEYPGIHKVWQLAQNNSKRNDYFLYFHSKGMVYHGGPDTSKLLRIGYNVALTKAVILQWKLVLYYFDNRQEVDKVGYISSCKGFVWFNFWYVLAS